MVTRSEDYSNFVHRLFNNGNLGLEACRNITFQVTGDCTLRCEGGLRRCLSEIR